MSQYKLTYFDVKGVAEPLRLLFHLASVSFEDIRIPHNPNPVGGPQNRFSPEIKQKLPYNQVPILEFDDVLLSQSGAIRRFLAKKFNLFGAIDFEAAQIDEIVETLKDYTGHFKWRPWRPVKNEQGKVDAIRILENETTPKYLGKFNSMLQQKGSKWVIGRSWSWADVMLYHVLTYFGQFVNLNLVRDYPFLQQFVKNFEAIPKIYEWLQTRPPTDW